MISFETVQMSSIALIGNIAYFHLMVKMLSQTTATVPVSLRAPIFQDTSCGVANS
jgi:hypothetical protein